MTRRFKINPDGSCPELAGYKLPPCSRCQEDDVVRDAWASNPDRTGEAPFMYKAGYIEAREKFEFTESDLRQAFEAGRNMATDILECRRENNLITFEKFIQSLRTPRTPIAIEVEIIRVTLDGTVFPATNPDGTVKVVKWIFNE